eukprot:8972921-Alexandrium_andersonii.AAC.1
MEPRWPAAARPTSARRRDVAARCALRVDQEAEPAPEAESEVLVLHAQVGAGRDADNKLARAKACDCPEEGCLLRGRRPCKQGLAILHGNSGKDGAKEARER